ncbi:hypothetical protein LTR37_015382 [Vermiconidia calcicola]|uniref:Uncharacterized protein n=1 Tax=Vermiconidia calcicola TaxID=1690605 RepID=A0ACC3MQZ4_9PEZI|nr:hypothetical protein LTR37_015382 [Vermiconidia calcicola]
MSSTDTTSKSTSKGSKKSRIVILHLSPDKLAKFPADVKPKSSTTTKPAPSPSVPPPASNDKTSESNSTPVPPNGNDDTEAASLAPPKVDRRRRGGGTITGRKRAPPAIDPDAPPRERARPGPKKKPRLADGTIDHVNPNKQGPFTAPNPVSTHKLGPKANTGAINAGLRALDRSGKPCRKWERKGVQIKSFTGMQWDMPSWKAPSRDPFSGDVKSDSTGSSDLKPNGSSALPSDRSNSGMDNGDVTMTNRIESSPAPAVAA